MKLTRFALNCWKIWKSCFYDNKFIFDKYIRSPRCWSRPQLKPFLPQIFISIFKINGLEMTCCSNMKKLPQWNYHSLFNERLKLFFKWLVFRKCAHGISNIILAWSIPSQQCLFHKINLRTKELFCWLSK